MSDFASDPLDAGMTVMVKPPDQERADALPAFLQVEIGGQRLEQRFDLGLNAEVLRSLVEPAVFRGG